MFDNPLCLNKIFRGTEYAIATQNKYLIVKALLIKDLCLCVYLQSKFKVFLIKSLHCLELFVLMQISRVLCLRHVVVFYAVFEESFKVLCYDC